MSLAQPCPTNIEPRHRSILYSDDRQVKFLYVDFSQRWGQAGRQDSNEVGWTYVTARRARDVMADLSAAYELYRKDYDRLYWRQSSLDDAKTSPFYVPDFPDDIEIGWIDEPPLVDPTPGQEWLYKQVRLNAVATLQETILARNEALLADALAGYLADQRQPPLLADIWARVLREHRRLLLTDPISVRMPELPRLPGTSADFKQLVRAQLEDFQQRQPLFTTLLVPLKLIFLVIPPEQGKDLDNIPLDILPIAHDVLKPHIAPFVLYPSWSDRDDEPWLAEEKRRLRDAGKAQQPLVA
jgi:hypothetical protein